MIYSSITESNTDARKTSSMFFVCIEAVKKYGVALSYVKEQTHDICMEAVRQDGNALRYVKEQTYNICIEAVKQNRDAIKYVIEDYVRDIQNRLV